VRRRLERLVDRRREQVHQVVHPQAGLVPLVDHPVDLVQGGHRAQVEHREGEDVAEGDLLVDGQVRRQGQDADVEQPLDDRLAGPEEAHGHVVPQLPLAPELGRLGHAP
jgi:hypothetical protein